MSIRAAPSSSRAGELTLQPNYFTSSVYVDALRNDIKKLMELYDEQYSADLGVGPFTLFKRIWSSEGWKWLHFKVFDGRARKTFLDVTLRLFLERMGKAETPLSRVVGLFGLYTFFYTQPQDTAPVLYDVTHIPIPIDEYIALEGLAKDCGLKGTEGTVRYVVCRLLEDEVFHIVPRSELHGLNPRSLPREMVGSEDGVGGRKKGRPTKRDVVRRARSAVDELERLLDGA